MQPHDPRDRCAISTDVSYLERRLRAPALQTKDIVSMLVFYLFRSGACRIVVFADARTHAHIVMPSYDNATLSSSHSSCPPGRLRPRHNDTGLGLATTPTSVQ